MSAGLKLRATVTPEQFPFIEEDIVIVNKKNISIRSAHIAFYVTPDMVVAVKRSMENTTWSNQWEYKIYEIRTKIEIIG